MNIDVMAITENSVLYLHFQEISAKSVANTFYQYC